jgi:hypothetical protein
MSSVAIDSYFQFTFTPRQQEILGTYRDRIQARIAEHQAHNQAREVSPWTTPPAAYDQVLRELARFSRYLANKYQYQKVGLASHMLEWFTQEMRLDIDEHIQEISLEQPSREGYTIAVAANATVYELLELHYLLTRGVTKHQLEVIGDEFRDQYATEESRQYSRRLPKRSYIYTAGMDEIQVFTTLFNSARPQGMSTNSYQEGDITPDEGAVLMQNADGYFDYVHGRAMKISMDDIDRGKVDVTTYNQYNGENAAQLAIQYLNRV